VWRRSGEWLATGRPWEGSAGPDEVWALGGAAQRRVRAARGEQQTHGRRRGKVGHGSELAGSGGFESEDRHGRRKRR